jgi:hypothetical protein
MLMIGALATMKTMFGLRNKWPNRYQTIDKIADIFPAHPLALNLIHYNTKELGTLTDQLVTMTGFGGKNLHGFQLNIAWPPPTALIAYRERCPAKQIVLQVGGHALEMVDRSPAKLAERAAEYEEFIEYVLLDPSGGYGRLFDPEYARDCLSALRAKNLKIGLGIAGGLSSATLRLVEPLAAEFADLSIDAEGRLRDENDLLNVAEAKNYLREALRIFDR